MPSSGMLRCVALVTTEVLEECSASIIRVTVFLCSVHQLLVTVNIVPSSPIHVTPIVEALRSSETLVLTRATQCIGQDAVTS
jgi:hypothetical protein